jgi:serine/threonine-protein kinase
VPEVLDKRALYRLLDGALSSPAYDRGSWLDGLEAAAAPPGSLIHRLLARRDLIESAAFLRSLPKFTQVPDACPAPPTAAELGGRIGPYRLQGMLGSGGMGSVWLAQREGHASGRFALKLLHSTRGRVPPAEIIERERSILAALDHPQIVRPHDAGMTEQGRAYLALDYVDGEHIDRYCATRLPGIAQRLALMLQVTRVLAHAHASGVVHRDVKPANLLVDSRGCVHLVDFGIASRMGEATEHESYSRAALTPCYASPEQLRGEQPSAATDIFSLGVVLYELLTGRRPHDGRTDSPDKLDDALDAIVCRALRQSPAERYGSADELAADIEQYLSLTLCADIPRAPSSPFAP